VCCQHLGTIVTICKVCACSSCPCVLTYPKQSKANLDVSGNHLKGKLPLFLSTLTALTNLDLSNNNLAGPAPASLSSWFNSNSPTQHK
jgi:hypothetical protein